MVIDKMDLLLLLLDNQNSNEISLFTQKIGIDLQIVAKNATI